MNLKALVTVVRSIASELVGKIIIVNDGSTDNSSKVIDALRAEKPNLIEVIDLDVNKGRAYARLAGVQSATSKQVLLLDVRTKVGENFF